MGKWWKSYAVFTSAVYKFFVFLALPLFMVGMLELAVSVSRMKELTWYVFSCVALYEVFADNWAFGGLYEKTSAHVEYLKTSCSGLTVLKRGLALDGARRLCALLLLALVAAVRTGGWEELFTLALVMDLVVTVTLVILRHFDTGAMIQFGISAIAQMCCLALFYKIWEMAENGFGYAPAIGILIVLCVLAQAFAVGYGSDQVEGSYYDERNR